MWRTEFESDDGVNASGRQILSHPSPTQAYEPTNDRNGPEGESAVVDRNVLAAVAVGVVLVASIVGAAYVSDVGDTLLGGDDTETPPPTTQPTPAATDGGEPAPDAGSGGGGSGGGDATPTPKAYDFRFRILNTEACGQTCRDVSVKLTNQGAETATGVTAKSRILADGDRLWSGTVDVGTMSPGESVTRTERVKLGLFDAAKVKQNNGYVTIKTTVTWDDGSRTFTQRVKVA